MMSRSRNLAGRRTPIARLPIRKRTSRLAERLEGFADGLQKDIDAKSAPDDAERDPETVATTSAAAA